MSSGAYGSTHLERVVAKARLDICLELRRLRRGNERVQAVQSEVAFVMGRRLRTREAIVSRRKRQEKGVASGKGSARRKMRRKGSERLLASWSRGQVDSGRPATEAKRRETISTPTLKGWSRVFPTDGNLNVELWRCGYGGCASPSMTLKVSGQEWKEGRPLLVAQS